MEKAIPDFELRHVGINADGPENAEEIAKMFCNLFGFEYRPDHSHIFCSSYVEVVKKNGRGKYGHIALATSSITDAIAYITKRGIDVIEESKAYTANGALQRVYLDKDFAGFAVHLVQK